MEYNGNKTRRRHEEGESEHLLYSLISRQALTHGACR